VKTGRQVLLLLNGELARPRLVKRLAALASGVVCTDGGCRHAARLGLTPSVVIGDMDSLPKRLPRWKGTAYLCDFDEDCSDLEKAFRLVPRMGVDWVWVAGALGGRLDHALVNLALIEKQAAAGLRLALVHDGIALLAGEGDIRLACRRGETVSLLASSGGCVVSTRGLRYGLKRRILAPGSLGLSNRAMSKDVRIRVLRGRLLVIRTDVR